MFHYIKAILLTILPFGFTYQVVAQNDKPALSSRSFEKTIDALNNETVPLISVQSLHDSMSEYIILDAREYPEFSVSHIKNASYIGYDHWDETVLDTIDKDAKIVVYCSIGVRSEDIGEKLQERGFKQVYNLYGSIFEWANQGLPLVDMEGNPTHKIHGYSWLWGKWMTNNAYEKVYSN